MSTEEEDTALEATPAGPTRYKISLMEEELILEDRDGKEFHCKLVELDGTQRDRYLNASSKRTQRGRRGEVVGVTNFEGMYADLLVKTLFVREDNGEYKPATQAFIQALPSRVITDLHDRAKVMSALDKKAASTAKKN